MDAGITGATSATVHPSFTQLPLTSVHRWGREDKHSFLFHTRAPAPCSSAVSCQERTKLLKTHNPLIMICFLTQTSIPNNSKRSPQAGTGSDSPRALTPVCGAVGGSHEPFMLPYRMHIPLALQRGSSLASVLSQLLRTGTLCKSFRDDSHRGAGREDQRCFQGFQRSR